MAQIEVASVEVGAPGRVQSYEVTIDSQPRGRVPAGEKRVFAVLPGIHTVKLESELNSSPPVKVVVFGTTTLVCQTRPRLRFGLFRTGEPEMHIVVREHEERGARTGIGRREPASRGDVPVHDMLAAD